MKNKIETEADLDRVLSEPTPEVVEVMAQLDGDLMILGVGGKMGPTLAQMAKRAIDEAKVYRKIIGVSRFSSSELEAELNLQGIETIKCDLIDEKALVNLPDIKNIIFMAGRKFGSTGAEALTWAMNVYLPAKVAQRFRNSRLVVFSTGNVYPLTPIAYGGSREVDPVAPVGEYAQSCLGRERLFEYFSDQSKTPVAILRLNYAIELRYGVLLDIAQKVYHGIPINLSMGHVNVIWQADANAMVIRAFTICQSPPIILNLTGPETVSARWLATRFGELFQKVPIFEGVEANTALLSNASLCHSLFGYPKVTLEQMVQWVAHWVLIGGTTFEKPTHFEQREGRF